MAKQQSIPQDGTIVEVLPSSFFNVELDNGHIVRCTISGKKDIVEKSEPEEESTSNYAGNGDEEVYHLYHQLIE